MEREAAISAVLGAVQERWGVHSLTRGYNGARGSGLLASLAARSAARPSLPPWWPGAEGYLRPSIFELSGPYSCGKLGLALLWLAAASRGGLVAVVDQAGTFYPPAAAASGLDLERLVVIRPPDRRGALEAVSLLLGSAGFDAVFWPLEWKARPSGLDSVKLSTLAARSSTTLLALVTDHRLTSSGRADHGDAARLFPSADVRLQVTTWEWLWRDGEMAGVRSRVRTERMRGALAGQTWDMQLERHGPADAAGSAGQEAGHEAPARQNARGGAAAGRGNADAGRLAGVDRPVGVIGRAGGCPPTHHLCLAGAVQIGGGSQRAAGPAEAADRGVRSEPAAAPAARTA
ncbi:MAG: hypothetical protein AB7K36_25620 [Chloroflexota bacterium]